MDNPFRSSIWGGKGGVSPPMSAPFTFKSNSPTQRSSLLPGSPITCVPIFRQACTHRIIILLHTLRLKPNQSPSKNRNNPLARAWLAIARPSSVSGGSGYFHSNGWLPLLTEVFQVMVTCWSEAVSCVRTVLIICVWNITFHTVKRRVVADAQIHCLFTLI